MLRIHDLKLGLDEDLDLLPDKIKKRLNQPQIKILSYSILKESIDARNKEEIKFVYSIDFEVKDEKTLLKNAQKLRLEQVKSDTKSYTYDCKAAGKATEKILLRPVVVGFGPCGMFAALSLAEMGYKPIVIERGKALAERAKDVQDFWTFGKLDPESNVAFGEGGAGAFSDGKLTTQIKDPHVRKVLQELVKAGGPADILYKQKPHIGTDILCNVVTQIRKRIISYGGEVLFQSRLSGISINRASGENGQKSLIVKINDQEEIETGAVVIAIGHSARDTFQMLHEAGLSMAQKPFSIGVRVEHPQKMVNEAQYGSYAGNPRLGPADYKLVHHCQNGRGVYTFCMCPGGLVIGAASEIGCLVTNGMSYHSRASENANSALLVDVQTSDFPSDHPLAGIAFQRQWEGEAFKLGGGSYSAPAQKIGDFLAGRPSRSEGLVKASFQPGVSWTDISSCLPDFAIQALKEAIPVLGQKLTGFDDPEAILTAVETRSSSPVRILRDTGLSGSIAGIYPAGEGAGYAGGIISAAVDGIRAAEAIHANLKIHKTLYFKDGLCIIKEAK